MQRVTAGTNFTEWFDESVWVTACNFVGSNNKKVIDVMIKKMKHYFISYTKIGFKTPKFETFKTEESRPLVIIKNIKTRKSFSKAF